jgi:hypothetical protein
MPCHVSSAYSTLVKLHLEVKTHILRLKYVPQQLLVIWLLYSDLFLHYLLITEQMEPMFSQCSVVNCSVV